MVTAQRLDSSRIVCGRSNKLTADQQAKLAGDAWERLPEPRPPLTVAVYDPDGNVHEYLLGPHTPRLRPQEIALMHQVWLDVTKDPRFAGAHHYHIVALALQKLQRELQGSRKEELLSQLKQEIRSGEDASPPKPPN